MNIQEELVREHSKATTAKIVKYIGNKPERFDELVRCFFGKDLIVVQRAAWALGYSAIDNPEIVKRYLPKLINNLLKPNLHNAVKRNTLRLLEVVDAPSQSLGTLTTIAFNYLNNPQEAIAVRAFSITVLYAIVKKEPDLKNEFLATLKTIAERESTPAIISRIKRIMKEINKQK